MLHGGGPVSAEAAQTFVKRAGGPAAPIAILAQTADDPVGAGRRVAGWLRECGARRLTVSEVTRPNDIHVRPLLSTLAAARGVWIPEGSSQRFQSAYRMTEVPAAIRGVLQRGGVVGGSCEGAALLGEWLPTGRGDRAMLTAASVETVRGLGLVPGVIVDQQVLSRDRVQRLLASVLGSPELVGIGIDANAWAEIEPDGRLTVAGGQVVVISAHSAVRRSRQGHIGADDVRLRVLLPGESFSLPLR